MIRLYQFQPALGLPNASPFCMKVETFLRMAGLSYECPRDADLRKAPKGKLPYIVDEGAVVSDSSFIVDHLKRKYGDPLDSHLGAAERAAALACQRMLEENTYWAVLYFRWIDEAGWALTREAFFGWMKPPLKWIVPPLARRSVRRELHGHGMGRHARDEIVAIAKKDITAAADFLGDKPFFLGARPSSLDATAYAFLANILWVPLESPLKAHAQTYPQLAAYCARMREKYYGNQ
ncbi:MAG: glutathione S-transferase N-terminal domain-containing protein [Betaproteobacteria bacterium]|nr:glutathione S-transferase N-terminal domain-containing protein [Betaproteobacteria bacterium]